MTYVMSIYAFPVLAFLAVRAGVLSRKNSNGVNLLAVGLVVVDKVASLALGARSPQEVVIAELIRVLALLDRVHDSYIDSNGLIEAAGAGIPVGLLGRNRLVLRSTVGGRRRSNSGFGARAGLRRSQRKAHDRGRSAICNGVCI
jgi:hypothetical protein